jgi:hypothetical protein
LPRPSYAEAFPIKASDYTVKWISSKDMMCLISKRHIFQLGLALGLTIGQFRENNKVSGVVVNAGVKSHRR